MAEPLNSGVGLPFIDEPDPDKANERPRDPTLIDALKQERSTLTIFMERTNKPCGKDQPWNKARPLTEVAARLRRAVSFSSDLLAIASQSMQASMLLEGDASAWCAMLVQK